MKLYLVSGAHHDVPNLLSSAHLTPASADAEALRLVNMIRDDSPRDGLDSMESTPSLAALPVGADWREGLREAQRCIISFNNKVEFDAAALRLDDDALAQNSGANVEIVELNVKDAPALPAALETLIAEAENVADVLENALPVHIYDEDEPADNVYRRSLAALAEAIVIAKAAAIWQSMPAFQPMLSQETLRAIQSGAMTLREAGTVLAPRRDSLPGDLMKGDRDVFAPGRCELCVNECRGHRLGHPEEWIPEPGSRAALEAAGMGPARQLVERWAAEWLRSDDPNHWGGNKIDWSTARAVADRLDGALA